MTPRTVDRVEESTSRQPDESPEPSRPRPARQDDPVLLRRVSDLEREEVADVLRRSAGEGRLTYVEVEDRLEKVYAAKTYGELVEVTADLPEAVAPQPVAVVQPAPRRINVFLSDAKRTGPWLAEQRQDVTALLGGVILDYTEAQIPHPEIFIEARAVLSDIKIRVPANAVVHLEGQPILGSISEKGARGTTDDGPPVVFHVRATAILGDVKVRRGPRLTKRLGLS